MEPGTAPPALPDVEQLSPLVVRVLGGNPGPMTLTGTNTYLVGTGSRRILIDTGEGLDVYESLLRGVLEKVGVTALDAVLITHAHWDHIGGVPSIWRIFGGDVPIFKLPGSAECSHEHMSVATEAVLTKAAATFTLRALQDGQRVHTTGATLRTLATPGHTEDHAAFLLEEENSIFTGDCVLGIGSTTVRALGPYLRSLRALIELRPTRLYPGHGPVAGPDALRALLAHRQSRLDALAAALDPVRPQSAHELLSRCYPGLSDPMLLSGALKNVQAGLQVLLEDGVASCVQPGDGSGGGTETMWTRATPPVGP